MGLIRQTLPPVRLAALAIYATTVAPTGRLRRRATLAERGRRGTGRVDDRGRTEAPRRRPGGARTSGRRYVDALGNDLFTIRFAGTLRRRVEGPRPRREGARHVRTHKRSRERAAVHSQPEGARDPQDVREITLEGRSLRNDYRGEIVTIPVKRGRFRTWPPSPLFMYPEPSTLNKLIGPITHS
jgi:hypothetical protein